MSSFFHVILAAIGLIPLATVAVDYAPQGTEANSVLEIKTLDSDGKPVRCNVTDVAESLGGPLKERVYWTYDNGEYETMEVSKVTSTKTVTGTVCSDQPQLKHRVEYTVKPGHKTRLVVTVDEDNASSSSNLLSSHFEGFSSDGSSKF